VKSQMLRGPHRLALSGEPYRLGRSLIAGHSKAAGQDISKAKENRDGKDFPVRRRSGRSTT
jgi:hypothetical protein